MNLLEYDNPQSSDGIEDYFILYHINEYKIELPYDKVKNKTLLGETNPQSNFDVYLSNVSHSIIDMFIHENIVYGKVKILNTRQGKIVKALYECECMPVFKIRGIKNNDTIKVFTFDLDFKE